MTIDFSADEMDALAYHSARVSRQLRQLRTHKSIHWHPQDPEHDEAIDERITALESEEP